MAKSNWQYLTMRNEWALQSEAVSMVRGDVPAR